MAFNCDLISLSSFRNSSFSFTVSSDLSITRISVSLSSNRAASAFSTGTLPGISRLESTACKGTEDNMVNAMTAAMMYFFIIDNCKFPSLTVEHWELSQQTNFHQSIRLAVTSKQVKFVNVRDYPNRSKCPTNLQTNQLPAIINWPAKRLKINLTQNIKEKLL
jgi:hypothetical protein